ncbi:MAG: sulfotransferase family protein [Okeania sp. SIO2F4]|uniref:sulfotransferase-like domain-containing protein n=1 Tax=Okeania sp. SIO2F4 TaxID=2607790 RepID=UPI00142B2A2D|nr:sulfotransferase family protein [Okeania sp. SIO2F4]NES02295.1 sulfotransferase family protein [Okeania sp. SIO2F4]
MDQKIIALWSTPRSRSTAFGWMVKQRGDFLVLHEPFGLSAYYSEERIFNRVPDIASQAEYNYQNVLQELKVKSQNNRLFIKDFPLHFMQIVNNEFIDYLQHTFLIRNPAQMLPSYYYKMPDLDFEECGYKQLFELFNKVIERTGKIPVVINADDIVEKTTDIIKEYCSRIGIPFIPEALNWNPPGNSNEISWWDNGSWHDNLRISYGFQNTEKSYLKIHQDQKLLSLYNLCMPYYEKLNQHRLLGGK